MAATAGEPPSQKITINYLKAADYREALLRAEMARRGVTYAQLVERLNEIGVPEDERNVRNKVSRGKFTAAFLLQCYKALGARLIDISEL